MEEIIRQRNFEVRQDEQAAQELGGAGGPRGSWATSNPISSSRQRRTVDSDTALPPATSARR